MNRLSYAILPAVSVVLGASCRGDVTSEGRMQALPIIGGQQADEPIDETTGALYALDDGGVRFICSGVLIAPDVVLTAAHCIAKTMQSALVFSLQPVLRDLEPEDATSVRRRVVHEAFRWVAPPGEPLDDIALVELAEQRTEAFAHVDGGDVGPDSSVALVGYGATTLTAAEAEEAPGADMAASDARNVGIATVSALSARELTIESDVQACLRDSGGPALLWPSSPDAARVVGIASRALDPQQPCVGGSVYTRVAAYGDWIVDQRERWRQDVPTSGGCGVPR